MKGTMQRGLETDLGFFGLVCPIQLQCVHLDGIGHHKVRCSLSHTQRHRGGRKREGMRERESEEREKEREKHAWLAAGVPS